MLSKFFARFQFIPFWRLTYWGFTPITNHLCHDTGWDFYGKSADEFHNPTTYSVVPLVGMFTVFHDTNTVEHVSGWIGLDPQGKWFPECPFCVAEWNEVYNSTFDVPKYRSSWWESPPRHQIDWENETYDEWLANREHDIGEFGHPEDWGDDDAWWLGS